MRKQRENSWYFQGKLECNEKGEKWRAVRSEGEPGHGFYSGCDGSQWRRVSRETTQFMVLNDCSKTYSVIYNKYEIHDSYLSRGRE